MRILYALLFTTLSLGMCFAQNGVTFFGNVTPASVDGGADTPVNLGMQFKSDVNGTVTGIRFYKSAANTGTHIGDLWDAAGTKLAEVTFTGETASGWQTQNLTTPIAITAGSTYTVSYHNTIGHYSDDQGFFTSGVDHPPLHAPANAGVFVYNNATAFPSTAFNSTNYYVDIVINLPPPVISAKFIGNGKVIGNLATALTHKANLSWAASGSTGPLTYNVYRSNTSGGPYTIVASNISATQYSDLGRLHGTFFYVVTTVKNGFESSFSNEGTAVIP